MYVLASTVGNSRAHLLHTLSVDKTCSNRVDHTRQAIKQDWHCTNTGMHHLVLIQSDTPTQQRNATRLAAINPRAGDAHPSDA